MPVAAVTIVVKPAVGAGLGELTASGHVWIAGTTANEQEVQKRWQAGLRDVTTFEISQPLNPGREANGILGQVLLHHPGVREIHVIGCAADGRMRESLAAEGFTVAEQDDEGFTARL